MNPVHSQHRDARAAPAFDPLPLPSRPPYEFCGDLWFEPTDNPDADLAARYEEREK